MKRIIMILTGSLVLISLFISISIQAQGITTQQPQSNYSGRFSSSRGTVLIDPDDYQNCTGFMLNNLFLSSGEFFLNLRGYLELTTDQVTALREIRLDFTRDTADLKSELSVALIELEDMIEEGDIRVNALSQKIDDVYDLESEYQTERLEALVDARAILTDEQRMQVDELRRRRNSAPVQYPGASRQSE